MKLLTFIGLWLLCAVLSACIAASKGREWQGRLVGGVLIGPFGLLIGLLPAHYKKPLRLPPRLSIVCAIAAAVMSIGAFYALHIGYWGSAVLLFLVTGLLAEIVFLTDSADTGQEPDDPNPPTPRQVSTAAHSCRDSQNKSRDRSAVFRCGNGNGFYPSS